MVRKVFVAMIALLLAGQAGAEVIASVDRENVELNESFTLELIVDSNADVMPELSVLDADFRVGQTGQISNTTIVNGQIMRSRTWQITLMAKRAGQLMIPPIRVGNETSQALIVIVAEPTYAPPGEADVFITAEVDQAQTYVQAQVLYTIKVYRAVATRQPALREPEFTGAEVLVELAGDERSYESILNGRAYSVVERSLAVFPQESGEISISPAVFEARVLRDGRITGRKLFESEAQHVTVLPIPAPPAGYPDASWLPARDLILSDDWSREPDDLRAGEPISRNVTISALGQLETQIPAIEPPSVDGINVYPDKPMLERELVQGGIRGVRTDQYAIISTVSGEVTLPGLDLPWWDIDDGEWKIAGVPARTINIAPSEEMLAAAEAAMDDGVAPDSAEGEVTANDDAAAADSASDVQAASAADPQSSFWKLIAEILAAVWLLTLIAWWWSNRPHREEREPAPVPLHKQQAKHVKAARKAAAAGEAHLVRQALLEWARLEWPDGGPRSIGELARHVASPLSEQLVVLSKASYGPAGGDFDGDALANALRTIRSLGAQDAPADGEILPPLMPESS